MSDYRNPNDPLWRGTQYDPDARSYSSTWGWIAGALVLAVLVAIAFGIGHGPTQTASNDVSPAPMTRTVPPPAVTPNPTNPANPHMAPPARPGTGQPQ